MSILNLSFIKNKFESIRRDEGDGRKNEGIVENFQLKLKNLLEEMQADDKYQEVVAEFNTKIENKDFENSEEENKEKAKYNWLSVEKSKIDEKDSIDEATDFVKKTVGEDMEVNNENVVGINESAGDDGEDEKDDDTTSIPPEKMVA